MGLTDYWWVDSLIAAAAGLTAWQTIWKRALKPLFHAIDIIAESVPTLVAIAREFPPSSNGGGTVRETIDRIEATQEKAHTEQLGILRRLGELAQPLDRIEKAQGTVVQVVEETRDQMAANASTPPPGTTPAN